VATTQTKHTPTAYEKLLDQIDQLREQALESAREAGTKSLDSYAQVADRAIGLELKLAELSEQEWLKGIIDSHAQLARDLTDAYVSAGRELLK
jgi:hypothetical protein